MILSLVSMIDGGNTLLLGVKPGPSKAVPRRSTRVLERVKG